MIEEQALLMVKAAFKPRIGRLAAEVPSDENEVPVDDAGGPRCGRIDR